MSTITALVHTKNSARTLEQCLASLQFCDQVFVIDMESTDETLKIAKKFSAKIFSVKTGAKFADPIRNEYIQKVTTEWTLIVDSDEEVPPTLAKKIQEVTLTQGIDGYQLPRKNLIFGNWIEHTGFWPDYIVRLFRTGKGSYPPFVHAQPKISGVIEKLPAKEEFALIHHHYESIEQFILRLNVYTTLEAEKAIALYNQSPSEHPLPSVQFLSVFFSQFFTRYFDQKGYKDGTNGFVLSLLMGVYTMVVAMKVWEIGKKDVKTTLEDVEYQVNDGCRGTMYWVANEKLLAEKNIVKKLGLQVKRKLQS